MHGRSNLPLRVRRLAGRVVRRAAQPALQAPDSPVVALRDRVAGLEAELAALRAEVEQARSGPSAEIAALARDLDERFAVQDASRAEVIGALELVRRRVERAERAIDPLEQHVESTRALPYTGDRVFETFDADGAGRVLGFRADADGAAEHGYVDFEEVFRGPEDRIRELQRPYLGLIGDRAPVLDVGCGRGEMLDLLAERGIEAAGVDTDPGMVERCRAKGHERVELGDAVAYLEGLGEGELGAVFSAQVVEHVPFEPLQRLLAGARHALRDGGLFIAETVNPHAPDALKGFWLDPTHQHPLFPEVLLTLCRAAGFGSAYVFHPNGAGDVDADRFVAPAYAVVATK